MHTLLFNDKVSLIFQNYFSFNFSMNPNITHPDLRGTNLDHDHRRNKCTQSILTEDCEENIRTCQRRRTLENKNKQGNTGYIRRGR